MQDLTVPRSLMHSPQNVRMREEILRVLEDACVRLGSVRGWARVSIQCYVKDGTIQSDFTLIEERHIHLAP